MAEKLLLITDGNMTRGGLRAGRCRTVTTARAGQILSKYHNTRLWLYCVLAVVFF